MLLIIHLQSVLYNNSYIIYVEYIILNDIMIVEKPYVKRQLLTLT